MALLKNDEIVEDLWTRLDDDADIETTARPIISLTRWRRDRNALLGYNGEIGLVLRSDESPATIADDLGRFSVICLDFPKFTDGRGYSYARLLRSRYDYKGEIRAIGNVLRDQALFMRRCGIDALEIGAPANAETPSTDGWREAFAELSVRYQPAEDSRTSKIVSSGNASYLSPEVAGTWSY